MLENKVIQTLNNRDLTKAIYKLDDKLESIKDSIEDKIDDIHKSDIPTNFSYTIDQTGEITNPDDMVDNFTAILPYTNEEIKLTPGYLGDSKTNLLTWLKEHTHAYVGKYVNGVMRLKQLDDTDRRKFADGKSSINYITANGDYDVFIKFDTDIYYRVEQNYEASDGDEFARSLNNIDVGVDKEKYDYIKIIISTQQPDENNPYNWNKYSKHELIGVYEACKINDKLYSLSNKRPITFISYNDAMSSIQLRGENFSLIDYETTKILALLCYGYYGSLDVQRYCGCGSDCSNTQAHYPRITGNTDYLSMKDTDSITGNGPEIVDEEQMKAGIGPDIKSINFWGIENYYGDIDEWVCNLKVMQASRPSNVTDPNPDIYISDYLENNSNLIVTIETGDFLTFSSKESFLQIYSNPNSRFLSIRDKNNNDIIRVIYGNTTAKKEGCVKKMLFGHYADIVCKEVTSINYIDKYFTDWGGGYNRLGDVSFRSQTSNNPSAGVGALMFYKIPTFSDSYIGTRIMYHGNENNIYIINDETETL